MEREVTGLPLSEAMESPVVQEWIEKIPWMKNAFVDGRIVGVLFISDLEIINVSDRMSESEINKLKTKLDVIVGIQQ